MIAPDDQFIQLLDRATLAIHDRGISRRVQMRVVLVVTMLVSALLDLLRGESALVWFVVFPLVMLALHGFAEIRVRLYGVKLFNTLQMVQRTHPMAWARFPIYLLILFPSFSEFPLNLDNIVLVLCFYTHWTLEPEEPPKRKIEEVLEDLTARWQEVMT